MSNNSRKLKIGFVLDDSLDKSDGVQQYILTLGTWLQSRGHDVHYLVGQTRRTDIATIHSLSRNINVRFNGNRMSMPLPSSKGKLASLLRKEKFDVLHIQLPYSPYLAHKIILAADPTTAVIGTFHIVGDSVLVKMATKLLGNWTNRSLSRFDSIVSVSEAAKDFASKTFKITSIVLPNVIDRTKFTDKAPLTQYIDKNEITILFLGRLVARKGCMTLLQAINALHDTPLLPRYRVIICGKGSLESSLKQYVEAHELKHVVRFMGYVSEEEKPHYYSSADIAVFPSKAGESFGIVLLEAMTNGHTAVLAGNNVGYHSVLQTRPELLFNPYSIAELKDSIKDLLVKKDKRLDIAHWGYEYSKVFDVTKIGPKLEDIYYEGLRKRHKA